MSSPIQFPPPGFDDLSKEEQATYVEELSNYVYGSEDAQIPDWHWEILEKRMADSGEDLENGTTWEEFEKELKEELRQN
jgi:hypothetical protein